MQLCYNRIPQNMRYHVNIYEICHEYLFERRYQNYGLYMITNARTIYQNLLNSTKCLNIQSKSLNQSYLFKFDINAGFSLFH